MYTFNYKVDDRVSVSFECDKLLDSLEIIDVLDNLFGKTRKCGKCGSANIAMYISNSGKSAGMFNCYCRKCHAEYVGIGKTKNGRVFVVKKVDELLDRHKERYSNEIKNLKRTDLIPNNGWLVPDYFLNKKNSVGKGEEVNDVPF